MCRMEEMYLSEMIILYRPMYNNNKLVKMIINGQNGVHDLDSFEIIPVLFIHPHFQYDKKNIKGA